MDEKNTHTKKRLSTKAKVFGALGLTLSLGAGTAGTVVSADRLGNHPTVYQPADLNPTRDGTEVPAGELPSSGSISVKPPAEYVKQLSAIEGKLAVDTYIGTPDVIKTGTAVPAGDAITPDRGHPNKWVLHAGSGELSPTEAAEQPAYTAGVSNEVNSGTPPTPS
jgi:hypothetical protein